MRARASCYLFYPRVFLSPARTLGSWLLSMLRISLLVALPWGSLPQSRFPKRLPKRSLLSYHALAMPLNIITCNTKKKRGHKKSALNSLSSLAEVLPLFKERSPPKQLQLHKRNQGRARQRLVVSEAKQLSKVLEHPQFKSNPFTTIHTHLLNTLGPVLEEKSTPPNKGRTDKKRSRKKKKKNNDMEE